MDGNAVISILNDREPKLSGIRGWLRVFVVLLVLDIVGMPIELVWRTWSLLSNAPGAVGSLQSDLRLAYLIGLGLLLPYAVHVARIMIRKQSNAPRHARIYVIGTYALRITAALLRGEPVSAIFAAFGGCAWLMYLKNSARVAATFATADEDEERGDQPI